MFDGRFRAFDSSGNPLSEATLTIYDAGTSNATSIFRDAALATPATNPTSGADVSDAGGWFPQFFAAEGSSVDITLKNSAGTTVKTYEDVPFLGSDTGTFLRTLAGGTRFKISDSGGTVLMQVGDASPDDTGGALTIEGWAGTQGDTLTLDFGTVAITGSTFTVNGDPLDVVLESGAHSGSADLDITLPTGYRSFTIELSEVLPSAAAPLNLLVSVNSGSSYLATGYTNATIHGDNAGTLASAGSALTTYAYLSYNNLSNTAGRHAAACINVDTPTSGTANSRITSWCGANGGFAHNHVEIAAGARLTNVRIQSGSGTWAGRWRLRTRRD